MKKETKPTMTEEEKAASDAEWNARKLIFNSEKRREGMATIEAKRAALHQLKWAVVNEIGETLDAIEKAGDERGAAVARTLFSNAGIFGLISSLDCIASDAWNAARKAEEKERPALEAAKASAPLEAIWNAPANVARLM